MRYFPSVYLPDSIDTSHNPKCPLCDTEMDSFNLYADPVCDPIEEVVFYCHCDVKKDSDLDHELWYDYQDLTLINLGCYYKLVTV